ncbi:MAG: Gfo/Idh/MocA family protein [Nitrospirales bacterium]|nr:Gfo/Idh/MocA family oxidoreductase [Nitrospirales bacterium]
MKTPLRIGVIGVGHLGQHHARIYAGIPGVSLRGVCDLDECRGKKIAEERGVPFLSTLELLIPLVDAVSVAVPTSSHFAVAAACLRGGCHVLVEKPITRQVDEGEQLVTLARSVGKILHVGHVERFNPIIEVIRPLIDSPGFIECHRLSPFQPRGIDVDVVRDLMIHDLDILLSLGLGRIREIEARGLPVLTDFPDVANVRIVFEQGCVATLTASRISTGRLRKLRIFQTDRYISVDFGAKEAVVNSRKKVHDKMTEIEFQQVKAPEGDALTRELTCFTQTIQGVNGAQGVTGEEGVEALRVANTVGSLIQQHMEPGHLHA